MMFLRQDHHPRSRSISLSQTHHPTTISPVDSGLLPQASLKGATSRSQGRSCALQREADSRPRVRQKPAQAVCRRVKVLCRGSAAVATFRGPMVSMVKKSQASSPFAWARKNCVQVGPPRRGAGPIRCRRRIRRTDDADTDTPRLRHSPTILTYPSGDSPAPAAAPGQPPARPSCGRRDRVWVRPATGHQLPMPAQQRRRRDQEYRPSLARQQLGQSGQQHPIRQAVARPGHLAAQHREQIPKDRDLDLVTDEHPATVRRPAVGLYYPSARPMAGVRSRRRTVR